VKIEMIQVKRRWRVGKESEGLRDGTCQMGGFSWIARQSKGFHSDLRLLDLRGL